MTKMIRCPSCNTEFLEKNAAWLKQAEYCAKHDRVRLAGTKCEFCEAESAPNSGSVVPGGRVDLEES